MSNEIELSNLQKNEAGSPTDSPTLKEAYEVANNEEKMINENIVVVEKEKEIDTPIEVDGTLNNTQVRISDCYKSSLL